MYFSYFLLFARCPASKTTTQSLFHRIEIQFANMQISNNKYANIQFANMQTCKYTICNYASLQYTIRKDANIQYANMPLKVNFLFRRFFQQAYFTGGSSKRNSAADKKQD